MTALPIAIEGRPTDAAHVAALVARGDLIANGDEVLGYGGPLVELAARLIAGFRKLGTDVGGRLRAYPVLIAGEVLARTDYFLSFPHQATLATRIDEPALGGFVDELRGEKPVLAALAGRTVPPTRVLSPAVCYHCYAELAGRSFDSRLVVIAATGRCFRHEDRFELLVRQREFTMHENIVIGDPEQVAATREAMLERVVSIARRMDLSATVVVAHDPFYGTVEGRARQVMQEAAELKLELVADVGGTDAAIASFNLHDDYFGRAFGITLGDGSPAHTACIAFGIERWIRAVVASAGPDPERWWEMLRPLESEGA